MFGYRGVVLFPWIGKVYDRDLSNKEERYFALDNLLLSFVDKVILVPVSASFLDESNAYINFDILLAVRELVATLVKYYTSSIQACFWCFSRTESGIIMSGKEVKGRTHTYYQVLIDHRDMPHIVSCGWNRLHKVVFVVIILLLHLL